MAEREKIVEWISNRGGHMGRVRPGIGTFKNVLTLEAHRKGVEYAIDLSARTGVPLVIEVKGKIKRIKPKYKYVRVPIQSGRTKQKPLKNSTKSRKVEKLRDSKT